MDGNTPPKSGNFPDLHQYLAQTNPEMYQQWLSQNRSSQNSQPQPHGFPRPYVPYTDPYSQNYNSPPSNFSVFTPSSCVPDDEFAFRAAVLGRPRARPPPRRRALLTILCSNSWRSTRMTSLFRKEKNSMKSSLDNQLF